MPGALSTEIATTGAPRTISNREQEIVIQLLREFSQYTTWRNVFAGQWEEAAQLIEPTARNTFFYGNYNWPGQKKTDRQIDATGMLALTRFAAICDSLLTPRNSKWHALEANSDYVMKDRATRLWFEQATKILFKLRYAPLANFSGQNYAGYRSLGAFGNATMFIDALDGRHHHGARGLRYKAVPLGETFFGENHQGMVDRVYRWFRLTAWQAAQKWGVDALPANLHSALAQESPWPYNFLHCVKPREDYDPDRLDARALPWSSHYVSIEGQCLMQAESGYTTFPYAISRYEQAPWEMYGRGPAQMVLPALKTLNAQKATFLKQGHRAADPVLLTADDGVTGMDMRPGAVNKGGVSTDGRLLVQTLPTGEIQISKEMMQEERGLIQDAFLVTLFQILTETPQMTATEVIERTNEKGILLAPTMGRQQSERLGPMIDRELDVAASLRLLPPMPPRLAEARGEYQVVYTSPLARAQRAQEAAGFMRTVESVKELVNITQDPSLLDPFDFDAAIPEIAEIQAVPFGWMADPEKIAMKRKARAQAQAVQQQIQAMPAQAAMLKAQATVAKAQPGIAAGQAAGGPQTGAG
jgi:head-to-tail connecting protein